ncbi:MAG TPA: ABC transporter ATP-binding protein [Geobacteraceae bacterium]|nr:ABC transporter ATP-binding protein [Geobacteraceae bacterium]
MAEIRFEKIEKSFGNVTVIRELDLAIGEGEFFTFVGPSGCGKSTILNMIAGLERADRGRIFFDDTMVNDLSPGDRDVAMVFQSYALYPHMTVRENLAFPLRIRKTCKETMNREVDQIAALLGLEELLSRKPGQLSGGQRQRVALGRAIIRRPKVFLMDEPLSNLDARLRVEMRAELKKLRRELGITIVYVTHDQEEALSLSDRIAVLESGRIRQCGTALDLYLRPADIFVAGFIGTPPMNVVRGTVREESPLVIDCNGRIISPLTENSPPKSDVLVGIRPDDLAVSHEQEKGSFRVTVSEIEPAGPFSWVDVIWNGVPVRGAARRDEGLVPGEKVYAVFAPENVLVFDAESGNRT